MVDTVIQNLVLPNMPCDVILALDAQQSELTQATMEKLQPYLIKTILIPKKPDQNQIVEFVQVNTALKSIDTSKYAYIMKTRSDAYIAHPIPLLTAVGVSDADTFAAAWNTFKAAYRALDPKASANQLLQGWVFTAGIPIMLHPMVMNQPVMPWSQLNQYEINTPLVNAIAAMQQVPVDDSSAMQAIVKRLAIEHKFFYIFGSTWVHFGARQEFVTLADILVNEYGAHVWSKHTGVADRWAATVTESHLRLSHLYHQLTCIDVMNPADYYVSFKFTSVGLANLRRAKTLYAFLLRSQQLEGDPNTARAMPSDAEQTLQDAVYARSLSIGNFHN